MAVEEKLEQLLDVLIGKMVPSEKDKDGGNNRIEGHHMTLFGANGMSGMVGEIMGIKQTLSTLDERTKNIGKWMKVGVTVTIFTLMAVLTHLGQESRTLPTKQQAVIEKEMKDEQVQFQVKKKPGYL